MTTVHTFKQSKKLGDIGEKVVKDFLTKRGYRVENVSIPEQKAKHIDFKCYVGDTLVFYVEVKTDFQATKTGNIFWEYEVDGKPGWGNQYSEDRPEIPILLIWYLPGQDNLYSIYSDRISTISKWCVENRMVKKYITNYKGNKQDLDIDNMHYTSYGYLIPLEEFYKFTTSVILEE